MKAALLPWLVVTTLACATVGPAGPAHRGAWRSLRIGPHRYHVEIIQLMGTGRIREYEFRTEFYEYARQLCTAEGRPEFSGGPDSRSAESLDRAGGFFGDVECLDTADAGR